MDGILNEEECLNMLQVMNALEILVILEILELFFFEIDLFHDCD
jgi:hypothetical protein